MSQAQTSQPDRAATLTKAVQDSTSVHKHRRRCKTRRLERTLRSLKPEAAA
jgi:hypothetical protein